MYPASDFCLFGVVDGHRHGELLVLLREVWSGDFLLRKLDRAVFQDVIACFTEGRADVPRLKHPRVVLVHDDREDSALQHVHSLELDFCGQL